MNNSPSSQELYAAYTEQILSGGGTPVSQERMHAFVAALSRDSVTHWLNRVNLGNAAELHDVLQDEYESMTAFDEEEVSASSAEESLQ